MEPSPTGHVQNHSLISGVIETRNDYVRIQNDPHARLGPTSARYSSTRLSTFSGPMPIILA